MPAQASVIPNGEHHHQTTLVLRPKHPQPASQNQEGSDNIKTTKKPGCKSKKKVKRVVRDWELYIMDETLEENWQRFLHDLGLGDFKSKTQCKKALNNIWVNISDFLTAVKRRNTAAEGITDEDARAAALAAPVDIHFFDSQSELAVYSRANKKIYPRHQITKDSPLKLLLAKIVRPR